MKPAAKRLVLAFVGMALAAANVLTACHSIAGGLTAVLWLALLFPVLGAFVLAQITPCVTYTLAVWLGYSTGIGVALTMVSALILNTAGLLFDFRAITTTPMLITVNVLLIAAAILWYRRPGLRFAPKLPAYHGAYTLLIPWILPLFAAMGAFRLNNNAGNGLAVAVLVAVCGYALVSAIMARNRHPLWYVVSLSSIALALALSVSLRSNHLLGFDINQEYQVFHAVTQAGVWQPHVLDGAYNACLSITLLPAALQALIPIAPEYVFKALMQVMLAVIPLVAFAIARRRFGMNNQLSYVTALFFVAQTQFIFQFPGLIRQQVALLFFGLLFLALSSPVLSRLAKNSLGLLFGLAMVLSHYSTAYICIAILGIILGAKPVLQYVRARVAARQKAVPSSKSTMHVSPLLLVILLLFTFMWYGQLLQASGGIVEKIQASVTNLNEAFKEDSRSDFLVSALGLENKAQDPAQLQQVYDDQAIPDGYAPTSVQYQPEVRSSDGPTVKGSAQDAIYLFSHKAMPLLINVLLLGGLLAVGWQYLLRGKRLDEAVVGVACAAVFALILTLPGLSQAYNIDRLYQQILLLIGPALVYALYVVTKRMPVRAMSTTIAAVLVLLLASTSGLIDQAAFRFSNVNLTNNGSVYDHYYVTDGEVASLQWVASRMGEGTLYADRYAMLPATAYSGIKEGHLKQGVLPTELPGYAYVYGSNVNINKGLAFGYYDNRVYTFNFADDYLTSQKNVIYTNNYSSIYR